MPHSFHTLKGCKMIWQVTEGFCCCSTTIFHNKISQDTFQQEINWYSTGEKKKQPNPTQQKNPLQNTSKRSFPQCCMVLKSVKTMRYQSCRKRTAKYFASFNHIILHIKLILWPKILFFHQFSKTALLLSNKEYIAHLTYLFLFFIKRNTTFSK